MNALAPFVYADTEVRAKVIDGEPCVLLADVLAVLDMRSTPGQVSQRLPDGVRRMDTIVDRLGRTQSAVYVTEAGLYRVVLRSDSPKAEPFIEWVTADVLPTIRDAGSYGSTVDMLAALPSSELLMLAAQAAKTAEDATVRAEVAEQEVKELTPAAQAWHDIAGAEGSWAAREAAQMLCNAGVSIGQNRLLVALDNLGWTFRQGGERKIKQGAIESRLLVYKAYPPRYKPDGERLQVAPQIRITGKGLDRLVRELAVAA